MNREFQQHSDGVEAEENAYISPEEAVRRIEAGEPIEEVLAVLDVDQCHFMPRVDDQGVDPVMSTGFPSQTGPSTGKLCFSIEEVERVKKEGGKAIWVVDFEMHDYLFDYKDLPDGMIVVCGSTPKMPLHALVDSNFCSSVLIDDYMASVMSLSEDKKGLNLENGQILREGDVVTIDPTSGRLWNKELPILSPCEHSQSLRESTVSENTERAALHMLHLGDIGAIRHMNYQLGSRTSDFRDKHNIGLRRTDIECREMLRGESAQLFEFMGNGALPIDVSLSLRYWDGDAFTGDPVNYRLPDFYALRDLMPREFQKELDEGNNHIPGTKLFKARETLYVHQLETAFHSARNVIQKEVINIIIPSVETPEEVAHFKQVVQDVTPEEYKDQVEFGVMIETKKALDNIEAIAEQCDCLCYGTNDLTAALMDLDRSVLDYSDWMKERGLEGRSPFEVLIPDVAKKVAESIERARAVNPDIKINICGHQVAGHDPASIEAVLAMGIDQITVPPTEEHYNRAQLTIARFMAQQKLACTPDAKMDLSP